MKRTCSLVEAHLILSFLTQSFVQVFSFWCRINPSLERAGSDDRDIFSLTDEVRTNPVSLRSSVTRATRFRIDSRGERIATGRLFRSTSPLSSLSNPYNPFRNSLRPEPTKP